MKLNHIIAKNCGVYENLHLDTSNLKLTSIIGKYQDVNKSNGSGKSTLLRIVYFGLLGKDYAGESVDSLTREGCDTMSVTLYLDFNGHEYIISRRRDGKASKAELHEDGELLCSGVNNVNAELNRLFGIGPDVLAATIFFMQDKFNSFTSETPATRKQYLSSILSLDEWTKYQKISKEHIAEIEKSIVALDTELGYLVKQSDNNKDFNSLLSNVQRDIVLLEQKVESNNKVLDELSDRMRLYESFKAQRELYQQSVSDIYAAEQRLINANKEFDRFNSEYEQKQRHLGEVKNKLKSVRDREGGVETLSAKTLRLTAEIERLRTEIEMLDHVVSALHVLSGNSSNSVDKCPICRRSLIQSDELKMANVSRLSGKKEELTAKSRELATTKEWLAEAEKLSKLENKFESESNMLFVKKEAAAELWRQSKDSLARLKVNSKSFASMLMVTMTEADYVQVKSTRAELKKTMDVVQSKLNSKRVEYMNLELEQKNVQEAKAKYDQLKQKRLDVSKKLEYNTVALKMFQKIPILIIDEAVEQIQTEANSFLREYEAPFSIVLETTKYTQEGNARDTLDIHIVTTSGEKRSYSILCGAEKAQVDIALRFSLSMLLCDRYDVSFESLFVDEALSAFDEYNKDITLKIFKILSKRFPQIFVISHDSSIRDVLPQSIVVNREGDKSRVEVFE